MQQTTPGAGGGGQAQQRELVYRVKVVADTQQANQAFAQMSRQAQGAASHYPQPGGAMGGGGMVYQPGGGGWVPGQPPPGGATGGGNAAGGGQDKNVGIAAGYAVLMSRLTVAVGFATTAMEKFKSVVEAVNTQGRETVNAAAKFEKWMNVIPVVGKPIYDFQMFGAGMYERYGRNNGRGYLADADANGRTYRVQSQLQDGSFGRGLRDFNRSPLGAFAMGGSIAEMMLPAAGEFVAAEQEATAAADNSYSAQIKAAREAAVREGEGRHKSLGDAYMRASEAAGFRSEDAAAQSRLLFARGPQGSSPYEGRSGRVRFDRINEYDQVIRDAERARMGAASGLGMAQEEAFRSRMSTQDARRGITGRDAFDAAQRKVDEYAEVAKTDITMQQKLKVALEGAEIESAKYAEQLAEYQKALNAQKEKTVSLAQAEYELNQKTLAVQQARLSVTEAKLKQNDGYTESFAFLNGGQRQGLVDSVRQLNDKDFGSLSPRQRELLAGSGITSDYLKQKARDYTNADPEARGQLNELVKATGQQTRAELLEQKKKLEAEIELKFKANPEELAAAIRQAFKLVDPELRKLIDEAVRLNQADINRKDAAGRAQNK